MHDSPATAEGLQPGLRRKTGWAWAVATFFGTGRMHPGPGTWGSAAAALLWMIAGSRLSISSLTWSTITAAFVITGLGIAASTRVERESGRTDPGYVVIDEVAGQWVALVHTRPDLAHMLGGFLLFRLFDILKPWPIRHLEKLPAGWGIMLDDVAAGLYALGVMQILRGWIGG